MVVDRPGVLVVAPADVTPVVAVVVAVVVVDRGRISPPTPPEVVEVAVGDELAGGLPEAVDVGAGCTSR